MGNCWVVPVLRSVSDINIFTDFVCKGLNSFLFPLIFTHLYQLVSSLYLENTKGLSLELLTVCIDSKLSLLLHGAFCSLFNYTHTNAHMII